MNLGTRCLASWGIIPSKRVLHSAHLGGRKLDIKPAFANCETWALTSVDAIKITAVAPFGLAPSFTISLSRVSRILPSDLAMPSSLLSGQG
jgi:hypothetical protein